MNTELQWRLAIPPELIHLNEVHVWRVSLDISTLSERLRGILSADELERAGRLYFERDQRRFIATRAILRKILGRYLGVQPHDLRFEYTANGKPVLSTNPGCRAISFNLSHSGSFALYAITRDRNIGIDVERVRGDIDVEQISRRYFSQREISSLKRVHKNKRYALFFQYWTRKEAFTKATGQGISFPMEQCDVSLIRGGTLSPITVLGDNRESSYWYGQDLFPGHGYAAAIAVEGGSYDLSCWHYSV